MPSLGFLGTVLGMIAAFDAIEVAGDISPNIVAGGMKVALITTIIGACIKCGAEVEIECNGADEADALKEAIELIESGLGE